MNAKQKQLVLQAADREWNQMMADINHKATVPNPKNDDFQLTPPPSDNVPGVTTPEPKVYTFNVLINGKVKHTIMDCDRQKAVSKANWIAKQAAIKGWPSSVRSLN